MEVRRFILIASAIALAATACNSRDTLKAPTSTITTQLSDTPENVEVVASPDSGPIPAANPRRVQVTLDDDHSADGIIPVEGGTVRATASDGTRFSLTLPPNALLSAENITITPIVEVKDLPLSGGLVASVHLGPEGLRLMEPAILTVEPTSPLLAAPFQLIGFAYHGNGEEFHLYPIKANDTGFEVQLMHFSGYGAGLGTQSDVDRQRDEHPPSSPEDQVYQDMDPGAGEQVMYDQLLGQWAGVYVSLISAQSDENWVDIALFQFITWRTLVQGFGLEPMFMGQIQQAWDYLAMAVTFAAQRAHMICVQNRDPAQIARILRWLKWVQRQPELLIRIDLINTLLEFGGKCAQFEIDFDSVIDIQGILGFSFHSRLSASNVPVRLPHSTLLLGEFDSLRLQGEGNLEYLEFTVSQPSAPHGGDCFVTDTGTSGSTLRVAELEIPINLNLVAGIPYYPPPEFPSGIELILADTPDPLEVWWEWSCPEDDLTWSYQVDFDVWSYTFGRAHEGEIVEGLGLLVRDWVEFEKDERHTIFAQKIYDRTLTTDVSTFIDGVPVVLTYAFHEKTILQLRHSPQR